MILVTWTKRGGGGDWMEVMTPRREARYTETKKAKDVEIKRDREGGGSERRVDEENARHKKYYLCYVSKTVT